MIYQSLNSISNECLLEMFADYENLFCSDATSAAYINEHIFLDDSSNGNNIIMSIQYLPSNGSCPECKDLVVAGCNK